MSFGDAPRAERFAVTTSVCGARSFTVNDLTASRQHRLMRLRSTAFGDTFFDTTHANCTPSARARGAMASEKSAPCTRRLCSCRKRTKSLRASRLYVPILCRKPRAAFSATSHDDVASARAATATQESVRTRALALLWLICPFHVRHYTSFFLFFLPLPHEANGRVLLRVFAHPAAV